jgi:RNA polymerase sigma factor (sigma-70 family)
VWEEKQSTFQALVLAVLSDNTLTEDVLQEAFARILQSGKTFDSREEAFNYLRRTVTNTAIDWYRRLRRYRSHFTQSRSKHFIESRPAPCSNPLTHLLAQEQMLTRKTLLREIHIAIGKLSPEKREAINIFFSPGKRKTIKHLCRERGVPYSTLRSRMIRGIDEIRVQLRHRGIQLSMAVEIANGV